MDDIYGINVAKTEYREAYNTGDVHRLLSVFDDSTVDMSQGALSGFGESGRDRLIARSTTLFQKYHVKLIPIIIDIIVRGEMAYDFGWHELILTPKDGGEVVRERHRYLELWKKTPAGDWKIALFMNNDDIRDELNGNVSHWYKVEEQPLNLA